MRIIPQYIDLEINILIIKILIFLNYMTYLSHYTILLGLCSFSASFVSLYITILNCENNVSYSEKLALRSSFIISFFSILIACVDLYLINFTQLLIIFSTFSLIYNFITGRGYRRYLSPFLRTSKKLFKNRYTEVKNSDGTLSCSICMDSNTDINFVITSCGHNFHKECVEQWLNVKNNCPNCRQIIK